MALTYPCQVWLTSVRLMSIWVSCSTRWPSALEQRQLLNATFWWFKATFNEPIVLSGLILHPKLFSLLWFSSVSFSLVSITLHRIQCNVASLISLENYFQFCWWTPFCKTEIFTFFAFEKILFNWIRLVLARWSSRDEFLNLLGFLNRHSSPSLKASNLWLACMSLRCFLNFTRCYSVCINFV